MAAAAAFREGIRRVNHAPGLVAGMFAVTLLVSLPLAYALDTMIAAHLGSSLAAESLATGTNDDWWQEFSAQSSGLGTTFLPTISGFAAVLNNLSGFVDHAPLAATIVGVTAAWMVLWSFLSGGIIDRFARAAPHTLPRFLRRPAACISGGWSACGQLPGSSTPSCSLSSTAGSSPMPIAG
jgi:hypothetical protein